MGRCKIFSSNTQLRFCLLISYLQTQPTLILTMFSIRALVLFVAAFMAVFAVALPTPGGDDGIENSCDGGQVQCCTFLPSFLLKLF